jgi:hypothetical protein
MSFVVVLPAKELNIERLIVWLVAVTVMTMNIDTDTTRGARLDRIRHPSNVPAMLTGRVIALGCPRGLGNLIAVSRAELPDPECGRALIGMRPKGDAASATDNLHD